MNLSVDERESGAASTVRAAYARRTRLYDPLDPVVLLSRQELERIVARLLRSSAPKTEQGLRVLEVGCGTGGNLLMLLRLGIQPGNLVGNELLPDRLAAARARLPAVVKLIGGDASCIEVSGPPYDIVFQSMVFSSILDETVQRDLAGRMWNLIRPGGAVLWYDFTFDNPANPDVRGISLKAVRGLFPDARIRKWRVTLAPPLARIVARVHPALYSLFNVAPFLRTHVVCWIEKPMADVTRSGS